ncbi:hypothetical protein QJS04_geneDACA002309 [Acorus gramineus]|uniref:Uncharacterized protein n=1 Tax=Acorus gramineus TaxID=55184 RepID=A0AAV9A8T5_ACOGR|nr:hypothetical protein QJS04_geneDACA002309 [Acorus gramineus]
MTLNLGSKKRIHAMSVAKKTSTMTVANVWRRLGLDLWGKTMFLKQIMWKLRSQWRLAMGSQKDRLRFGYDPQSYSLNFDDCSTCDHSYKH